MVSGGFLAPFCAPEVVFGFRLPRVKSISASGWHIRDGENPGYTLYDLADRLCGQGWQALACTITGTGPDIVVQRILIRLGVSRDMAGLLLVGFRDAMARPADAGPG